MTLVVIFFLVSVLLELITPWIPRRYPFIRAMVAAIGVGLLLAVAIYLGSFAAVVFTIAVGLVSMYRVINFMRIVRGRMHPAYLRRTCLRTTGWLAGVQATLLLVVSSWPHITRLPLIVWLVIAVVQAIVAVTLLRTVRGHTQRSVQPTDTKRGNDRELPTVTVAIAARNETDSLLQCLESVLSSNYPKLEIVVLDDCSQMRRTPEIIRSFAHDGVRFVPGAEPSSDWLARNQAYDTLAKAASGDYMLYCSTSVRMEPSTIRNLIGYAQTRNKKMISLLPQLQAAGGRPVLIEPMRAAWELLLPRKLVGRPAVSSTCWLVASAALKKAGGFAAVSRMVTPEAYFAKRFSANDTYSFIAGGGYFGVSSQKTADEQRAGAIRTLYPSLHRRPEVGLTAAVLLVLFGVLPFVSIAAVFVRTDGAILSLLAIVTSSILLLAYAQVLRLCYRAAPHAAAFRFPVAVLGMILLQHISLYRYEFTEVLWKDRNICIPVMHTIPHLPRT